MKYIFLYFLSFFAVAAFSQSKQELKRATENRDKYLFAVSTEPKTFDETVASEYITDEILVPVEINGKTYTFLFDTGAVSIVSPEILKALGLAVVSTNKFTDSAGNTSEEKFYMVPQVKLGNVVFQNVGVASFDLSKFSQLLCRPIDGIFGSNMMRVCNWEIDYEKPSVRMSTQRLELPGANRVAFDQNFSGTPQVKLDTNGINFIAEVDTGNNGSLDIPFEFFEKSRLKKSPKIKTSHGKNFYSLLGNAEQDELSVLADTIAIGNTMVSRRIRVSPSPMVLIGNDFFSPFGKIVVNFKKGEILLPDKETSAKPELSFGFTPLREQGKTIVGSLWKNSKADKSGIAINDEVISIDGTNLSALSEADWCTLRQKLLLQQSLKVVIRKPDGQILELALHKDNLDD